MGGPPSRPCGERPVGWASRFATRAATHLQGMLRRGAGRPCAPPGPLISCLRATSPGPIEVLHATRGGEVGRVS